MALLVRCPGCQTPLKCDEGHVGKKLRCSACNKGFLIRAVGPARASRRRKATNVWVLLGVAVLTAAILVGSVYVAVGWYRTPSGPAVAPTGADAAPARPPAGASSSNSGTPAGYDQRTGN